MSAYGRVEVHVTSREVTRLDLERLLRMGANLAVGAEFTMEEGLDGGVTSIIRLSENIDTGVAL